ncbi:DUF3558 domain-containing protein [Amycolatopsis nigrescens]|uniref:DUF3558 domain-containing protein n=1 Tax=Amycolatopsis nigrescens TaxID=381445 RepID=UPI00146EA667|nr:DUF3558 domain-containing protein [Amycolatopsis nigrescens]
MRLSKAHAGAAGVGVALLVLTGCSQEAPGTPGAQPSAAGSTGQSLPSTGNSKAPRVANPLDASKFATDPCTSLSQARLQNFGVQGSGRPTQSEDGVGCGWTFGANGAIGAGVSYIPKVENGLNNAYALNDANVYSKGYFVPTEVDGYPAVYNGLVDQRAQGACEMAVGISDKSIFVVRLTDRPGKDVCKAAANFAEAVVQTIKEGQ